MKKDQIKALRVKDQKDLLKILSQKRSELEKYFSKSESGSGKNLKVAKNLRREIAQILTIMNEQEILRKESKNTK